jgi:hypothetical protein
MVSIYALTRTLFTGGGVAYVGTGSDGQGADIDVD